VTAMLPIRPALPLLFALLATAGCSTTKTTVLGHPRSNSCEPVSTDKYYVYVLNGADPLHFARADELAHRIEASGFPHVRTARWFGMGLCEQEIRSIHRADPSARFIVIGYSLGSYTARDSANRLVADGIPVSMVAYIGGDYLSDSEQSQLNGVGRVVNVMGDGHPATGKNLFFNGTDITGARNVRLAGTGHFDLPGHPTTFATVFEEMLAATAD
jgi:hypothetical protein